MWFLEPNIPGEQVFRSTLNVGWVQMRCLAIKWLLQLWDTKTLLFKLQSLSLSPYPVYLHMSSLSPRRPFLASEGDHNPPNFMWWEIGLMLRPHQSFICTYLLQKSALWEGQHQWWFVQHWLCKLSGPRCEWHDDTNKERMFGGWTHSLVSWNNSSSGGNRVEWATQDHCRAPNFGSKFLQSKSKLFFALISPKGRSHPESPGVGWHLRLKYYFISTRV